MNLDHKISSHEDQRDNLINNPIIVVHNNPLFRVVMDAITYFQHNPVANRIILQETLSLILITTELILSALTVAKTIPMCL